jgi:hypothetical protein
VLALIAVTWDVLGLDTGRNEPHLTLSALSQAYRAMHAGLLFVWILAGIGYVVARRRMAARREEGAAGAASPVLGAGFATFGRTPLALLEGSNRAVGLAFWIGVMFCAAVIEVLARRSAGRIATAGETVRLVSRTLPARAFLIFLWGFAGWHLFSH